MTFEEWKAGRTVHMDLSPVTMTDHGPNGSGAGGFVYPGEYFIESWEECYVIPVDDELHSFVELADAEKWLWEKMVKPVVLMGTFRA